MNLIVNVACALIIYGLVFLFFVGFVHASTRKGKLMDIYHMLFGQNPDKTTILGYLGLSEGMIDRFRDVWVDDELMHIVICARTGGLNRPDYPNEALTHHPLYLYDRDDECDNTYAYYHFAIPGMEEAADVP